MGCRVITDKDEGFSCFYDSVTMTAFGPVIAEEDDIEAFQEYLNTKEGSSDPRDYHHDGLMELFQEYIKHRGRTL